MPEICLGSSGKHTAAVRGLGFYQDKLAFLHSCDIVQETELSAQLHFNDFNAMIQMIKGLTNKFLEQLKRPEKL
jgi:hypothetical protein